MPEVRRRRLSLSIMLLALCLLMPAGLCRANAASSTSAPRNIILMIADGWGYRQVEASGMYRFGMAGTQSYEQFPVSLAMSTYAAGGHYDPEAMWADADWCKRDQTDSAAAITAMATGVKTDNRMLGMGPDGTRLELLSEAAAASGLSSGVVSTVPFCHATPAGFGCHQEDRGSYQAIAHEMLTDSPLNLIMGCGHPWYDNNARRRSEPDYRYIAEQDWQRLQAGRLGNDINGDGTADPWTLMSDPAAFDKLAREGGSGRIFGLPRVWGTLQERRRGKSERPWGDPLNPGLPDLATLSLGALNVLASDPEGCFLMIEGGAVDWAGHDRGEARLIEEMQDFNYAVDCVSAWIEQHGGWDENLLVVTGDHECGYLCGPGSDRLHDPLVNNGAGELPGMEFTSGSHTNQLIPLFAKGRGAELLLPLADETDPVRGSYLDNAELGRLLLRILQSR
jgi:alkaline phosphatase